MAQGGLIETVRDNIGSDKAAYDWVQTFADNLKMENFIDELGIATDFAHALCGLFALFYVCRIVWRSWANGSQLDIYKAIKPLVIGMAIMFFSTISSAVDFITDSIGLATQEFSHACSTKSEEQFESYVEAIGNSQTVKQPNNNNSDLDEKATEKGAQTLTEKEEKDLDKSTLSKIADLLGDLTSVTIAASVGAAIETVIWSILQSLAVLLASIIACCVLCMGFIGKCVFYFFGPFLFAMELIPGMEGRILGWFKKYMTYSLYPCIINIVNGVLVMLMVTLSDLMLDNEFYAGHGFMMMERAGMIHFIISFIGAFMFMSVPSVASQIMETASNGLGGSGMIPVSFAAGKAGDGIASKIGKGAAASATGGASKVVETGAQVMKGAGNMSKQMSSDSNFKGGA